MKKIMLSILMFGSIAYAGADYIIGIPMAKSYSAISSAPVQSQSPIVGWQDIPGLSSDITIDPNQSVKVNVHGSGHLRTSSISHAGCSNVGFRAVLTDSNGVTSLLNQGTDSSESHGDSISGEAISWNQWNLLVSGSLISTSAPLKYTVKIQANTTIDANTTNCIVCGETSNTGTGYDLPYARCSMVVDVIPAGT